MLANRPYRFSTYIKRAQRMGHAQMLGMTDGHSLQFTVIYRNSAQREKLHGG